MNPLFRWVESSAFSVWLRESTSILAYPAFLSAHAIGMALAVGVSVAVALHVLGVAPRIPPRELRRYVPILWFGFALNAASGMLLLIAYPTKALTNPVFALKLALIGLGMWLFVVMERRVHTHDSTRAGPPTGLRRLATASLISWAGAITAGRLLAYTYRRLFVDF